MDNVSIFVNMISLIIDCFPGNIIIITSNEIYFIFKAQIAPTL